MTVAVAVIGKSGSGKTTLVKSILNAVHNSHPDKSVLLVDNDLSTELGRTFGVDIKNTIHDIRTGNYKYKAKIPEGMTKQEFVEWALQDILANLYDDIDLIISGPVSTKDCNCFIAEQIDEALVRLINSYDFVIFDCEYDLAYLNQLVDFPIDVTLIVADTSVSSVYSSEKIKESSLGFAAPGQLGIVLNKVKNRRIPENISAILTEYDIDILGTLPYDEKLEQDILTKDSELLSELVKELLFRLNLPPL